MIVPVPEIGVAELQPVLHAGALLLDVREPHEFAEVRAPQARNVPLQSVPDMVHELPVDVPVYVICRSGGRSHNACAFLRERGIDAVNVVGGTAAWVAAGIAVASGQPS